MSCLQPAKEADLARIVAVTTQARIFVNLDELRRFWERAPWRVRVTSSGEAAIVDRWRKHLDIMVIRGLWCSRTRIVPLVSELRGLASDQGFAQVLSPLVPRYESQWYSQAGMRVIQEILAYRLDRPASYRAAPPTSPAVWTLRLGGSLDLEGMLEVDASAFDEFWRYDDEILGSYAEKDRVVLAEMGGRTIGYTLCTLTGEEGVLGRLAVARDVQGLGAGKALLDEVLDYLGRSGARWVTLSTQVENEVARRLYEKAGFKRLPGVMVGMLADSR